MGLKDLFKIFIASVQAMTDSISKVELLWNIEFIMDVLLEQQNQWSYCKCTEH